MQLHSTDTGFELPVENVIVHDETNRESPASL